MASGLLQRSNVSLKLSLKESYDRSSRVVRALKIVRSWLSLSTLEDWQNTFRAVLRARSAFRFLGPLG